MPQHSISLFRWRFDTILPASREISDCTLFRRVKGRKGLGRRSEGVRVLNVDVRVVSPELLSKANGIGGSEGIRERGNSIGISNISSRCFFLFLLQSSN